MLLWGSNCKEGLLYMFFMTYRTSSRRFEPVTFCKNKTAFQAFGWFNIEMLPGFAERFLYMLKMIVYFFFRYPDLCRNIFCSEKLIFLQ